MEAHKERLASKFKVLADSLKPEMSGAMGPATAANTDWLGGAATLAPLLKPWALVARSKAWRF
eukprot:15171469-Alexandrium_andersonii.AAC.1